MEGLLTTNINILFSTAHVVKKALFGILKVMGSAVTDNLSSKGIPVLPINSLLSMTI